jgi:hypothetical protein
MPSHTSFFALRRSVIALRWEKVAFACGIGVGANMQSQSLRELYEHVAPLAAEVRPQVSHGAFDRPSGLRADRLGSARPSIGRRMFRAFVRFCIGVLIGVSATLAWQSHGAEAEKIIVTWLPSVARLLPNATSAQVAAPQSAPTAQISAPAAAITSSEMTQQLKTMANDLADAQHSLGQLTDIARDVASTRQNLEQLAARQEQIAQSIATLQRFEQDVKQSPASAPQSVPLPRRRPTPPAAQSSAVQASSVRPAVPSPQQPLPLR